VSTYVRGRWKVRQWLRRFLPAKRRDKGEISARTLRMIDAAMENMKKGKVGPPIDPEQLRRLAR
jgi:hypothetical protein